MAGESGTTGHPGAGGSYLPPVFTRWTERDRPAPRVDEPAFSSRPPIDAPRFSDVAGPGIEGIGAGVRSLDAGTEYAPRDGTDPESELILEDVIEEGILPGPAHVGDPYDALASAAVGTWEPAHAAAVEPGSVAEPSTRWSEPAGSVGGRVTDELADRLERFAARLRTEGAASLGAGLSGDRLDTLLAGILAGYLAARDG